MVPSKIAVTRLGDKKARRMRFDNLPSDMPADAEMGVSAVHHGCA